MIHLFQDSCVSRLHFQSSFGRRACLVVELLQAMTVAISDTTLIKWLLESAQDEENDGLLWDAS